MRTLQTAGRTVIFSSTTVAASLAALLVFPLYFLRSFAYAGIAVTILAAVGAVVVLPAILAALGTRVDMGAIPAPGAPRGLGRASSPPSSRHSYWPLAPARRVRPVRTRPPVSGTAWPPR